MIFCGFVGFFCHLYIVFYIPFCVRPFLLYIGIFDVHRCAYGGRLGDFCENFGDGTTQGTGVIPDWKPIVYRPEDVEVPYFLPDTPATRGDLANMYKTYSRFDQGTVTFGLPKPSISG